MTEALFLEIARYEEQLQEIDERQLNVSGVMRILGISRSGYISWKDHLPSDRELCKEKIKEQFNPDSPDAVWCSDITYIWTFEGFVYLTSIMD